MNFINKGNNKMNEEKEITVELDITLDELKKILEENNFKVVDDYQLNDIYMINKNDNNEENRKDYLELLSKCVLIRQIIQESGNKNLLTYKFKEYNEKKEIVKQGKFNTRIEDAESTRCIFEKLNFEKLINVNDHIIVYANGEDEIAVQSVNDKHLYIEVEEDGKNSDVKYKTIEDMKNVFTKYNIPLKSDNYFVKKAEIELIEKYGDENQK
jgi:predicted adenylyl cyclase CyaB